MAKQESELQRRVKELLERSGLSARALSKKAKLSLSYVGSIVEGRSKSPERDNLIAIAKAAGVDPDFLVTTRRQESFVRYPSLEELLSSRSSELRWSSATVAAARSLAFKYETDPGELWWVKMLDALEVTIKTTQSMVGDPTADLDEPPRGKH